VSSAPYILAVGFVTPWFFAAGFVLASIPIIIHILNRRRFKTVNWAAMEFLLRALRRNRRRLRFEQWLLLAMRCLVLFLLGLALARPMGCADTTLANLAARRAGLHVIVIDNSYSMAYESDRPGAKTNLDQAKILAKGVIDRMSRGGESVAIITAARPATAILAAPIYDLQAAKDAIDRVEQSYSGTDLAGALDLARQIGQSEASQPTRTLHLITDATRSAWAPANASALPALGRDLVRSYKIVHYDVGEPNAWNQAVIDLHSASHLVRSNFDNDFLADTRGFGNGSDPVLQWKLDQEVLAGAGAVHLTPEPTPQVESLSQIKQGGLHVITANLATDDRLKADDVRRRVIDVASELKVLIVEGERGAGALSGSGVFLQLALSPPAEAGSPGGANKTSSYVQSELISDLELGNKVLGDYRAIILCGVGSIQPTIADQLEKFVQQGGTLILFMGDAVTAENYNATLLPRHLLPGSLTKRVSTSGENQAYQFDFQPHGNLHPLLSVFRGADKPGLDTAQVFTYWQCDVPADAKVERVLNYLPPGGAKALANVRPDPAITVQDLGDGRVVFVSTTANADWTSLPAKPAYVALMHELLAGSVSSGDTWMNLVVGDELQIPAALRMTAAPTLKDANQGEIALEQTNVNGAPTYHSRPIAKPGLYTLATGERSIPIAVNVPGDEADVRAVDSSVIRKALGDIDIDFEADQLPPLTEAETAGNDFGWSVMTIVLAMVGLECFLAMKFGHYKR
jgi:hypothetical protein